MALCKSLNVTKKEIASWLTEESIIEDFVTFGIISEDEATEYLSERENAIERIKTATMDREFAIAKMKKASTQDYVLTYMNMKVPTEDIHEVVEIYKQEAIVEFKEKNSSIKKEDKNGNKEIN